ncbi:hypothetical protein D3C86_2172880 [compost metagenome]
MEPFGGGRSASGSGVETEWPEIQSAEFVANIRQRFANSAGVGKSSQSPRAAGGVKIAD